MFHTQSPETEGLKFRPVSPTTPDSTGVPFSLSSAADVLISFND
jgi:hypothetical protein